MLARRSAARSVARGIDFVSMMYRHFLSFAVRSYTRVEPQVKPPVSESRVGLEFRRWFIKVDLYLNSNTVT